MKSPIDPQTIQGTANYLSIPIHRVQEALGEQFVAPTYADPNHARLVFYSSTDGTTEQKRALEAWERASLVKAQAAQSRPEIFDAYRTSPVGSQAEKIALDKWNALVINQLKDVRNVTDAWRTYKIAPRGSTSETAVFKKWIRLCKNVPSIKRVLKKVHGNAALMGLAYKEWDEISRGQLSQATTAQQARLAYANANKQTDVARRALARWDELALNEVETFDPKSDIRDFLNVHPVPQGLEAEKALIAKVAQFIAEQQQ